MLGREIKLERLEERVNEGGRWVLLVEMDRKEVLRRGEEIGRRWRVGVDEDLTMEERRMR